MSIYDLDGAKPLEQPPVPRVSWIRGFLISLERLQPPISGHHSLTFGMVGSDQHGWLEQLVLTLRPCATQRGGVYVLDEFDLEGFAPSAAAARVHKSISNVQEAERKAKQQ